MKNNKSMIFTGIVIILFIITGYVAIFTTNWSLNEQRTMAVITMTAGLAGSFMTGLIALCVMIGTNEANKGLQEESQEKEFFDKIIDLTANFYVEIDKNYKTKKKNLEIQREIEKIKNENLDGQGPLSIAAKDKIKNLQFKLEPIDEKDFMPLGLMLQVKLKIRKPYFEESKRKLDQLIAAYTATGITEDLFTALGSDFLNTIADEGKVFAKID